MARELLKNSRLAKYKYNFNPVLQNNIILYFFFLLALLEIIYFLNIGDIASLVFFLITGLLSSFFSKNMIVILTISLALTNIWKFGIKKSLEGFDNAEEEEEKKESIKEGIKGESDDEKKGKKDKKDKKEGGMENETEKKNVDLKTVTGELKEFDNLQKDIISGMKDIGGLLDKAETFVEKFQTYNIN
jgi:hypothetical protein